MKPITITAKSSTSSTSVCHFRILRADWGQLLPAVIKGFVYIAMLTFSLVLGTPLDLRADTCPDNNQPAFTVEETLDSAYQPPDGPILKRFRFTPPGGALLRPTVLMLPPDVFKLQYEDHGVPSERGATYDLQQAGFLVFQIEHRLAPGDGFLPGQDYQHGSLGRPPDQTDDVKRQILAALADSHCNGSIYLIGGSAGGTLALWCALDSSSGLVPQWNESVRQHIKAVVSLSGPADMIDWRYDPLYIIDNTRFENDLDNYVGLDPQTDTEPLHMDSPVSLVTSTLTSSPAVMLYGCLADPVPYEQGQDMYDALFGRFGLTLDLHFHKMNYTVDGTDHAYLYWHEIDTDTLTCVSHEVITFLQSHP